MEGIITNFPKLEDDTAFTVAKVCEDLRSKVAVLLMASSGLRIGGLRELQIGDIKKIDEFNLHIIWVYNRSRKDRYYTFCSPECSAVIDEYLMHRQKCGEQLKEKSPLIRDNFDIDNPFTAQTPNFISRRGMFLLFEEALNRAKVNPIIPGQKKRAVACSHGFRKFFVTQCDKAHLDYTTWKYLAGHKLPRTDASYIRTTEEDRLAEYAKAVPLLTISPEHKLKTRVQQLESQQTEEIERLKMQLQSYKDEQARAQDTSMKSIRELRKRLDVTEDKHEKALLALEHTRKTLIHYDEKYKQEKFVS